MQLTQQATISDIILKEGNKLFNFIRKRVKSTLDAEDILQDVYYQLAKISNEVNSIERMSAWLFQVARNKITDNYRKKKSLTFSDMAKPTSDDEDSMFFEDFITDEGDLQEDLMTRDAVWDALAEGLEELPIEQREVFEMHEFGGKSFKEISEITGVQVNTLLSRKRYATVHLREKLAPLYKELVEK